MQEYEGLILRTLQILCCWLITARFYTIPLPTPVNILDWHGSSGGHIFDCHYT